MTLSAADQKWREERLAPGPSRKPGRGGGERFKPWNAIVYGGWLGALTNRELRVWAVIYCLADQGNRARASHGTIARLAGMRREDAARTTRRLEERGLLRVLVRGRIVGQAGNRTANEYQVLVPSPVPNSGGGATNEEPE